MQHLTTRQHSWTKYPQIVMVQWRTKFLWTKYRGKIFESWWKLTGKHSINIALIKIKQSSRHQLLFWTEHRNQITLRKNSIGRSLTAAPSAYLCRAPLFLATRVRCAGFVEAERCLTTTDADPSDVRSGPSGALCQYHLKTTQRHVALHMTGDFICSSEVVFDATVSSRSG